ncbi:MAG: NifU family protein [Alphaproteobacteria bacterium]|nr:NifU family protein [Alphaproteobacteria bacterium]
MIIETQNTSDENVVNFFPPQPILKSGQAEFADSKSLRKSPLAEEIFDIGEVTSLFITSELISVTKTPQGDWKFLKPQIMAIIMDYLSTGEEIVLNTENANTDTVTQIKGLLNARIRPAVKQDGGDIAFIDFKDGIVFVEMQGSCKGCPYAMVTLKEGVEKILKTYIPQVKEVRNINTEGE